MLVQGLSSNMRNNVKDAAIMIAKNEITDKNWQAGETMIFLKVKNGNMQLILKASCCRQRF